MEQAIYTLLTPESSIYSAQNLSRAANLASRKQLNITDLEADAEFDFDTRQSARGGGGDLSTNRESGRGAGRDELENFLGGSPTDPKSSPSPADPAADDSATSANSSEPTAPANDLAQSTSDAPPVQSTAEARARVVSHVRFSGFMFPKTPYLFHNPCECL